LYRVEVSKLFSYVKRKFQCEAQTTSCKVATSNIQFRKSFPLIFKEKDTAMSKEFVVLVTGKESYKLYDGQNKLVSPILGFRGKGDFAEFGIGAFRRDKTGNFWGLIMPHLIIQAWRGMKLVEQATMIHNSTLCDCYTVAKPRLHSSDERRLRSLPESFAGWRAAETARAQVLTMLPTTAELVEMLEILQSHNVSVSESEIRQAYSMGDPKPLPILTSLRHELSLPAKG
jgi:hypothetical protein